MRYFLATFLSSYFLCAYAFHQHKNDDQYLTVNLLRAVVDRMNKDYSNGYSDMDQADLPIRTRLSPMKEEEDEPNYPDMMDDDSMVPSIRDNEYLQHSSLWGHQFMTGGAGEGKQNLKPEGSIPNKNEVKTDAVLPAYCNPPNPCPIGFTTNDGCIQNFENTAAFSREYQASQKCMCDAEHMFDCPSSHEYSYDNDMDLEQIVRRFQIEHTQKDLVSKKLYPSKMLNPYLQGEMLPIAAKKGINVGF
ncbi:neuroendocrine protein 7B2-like [Planococcus citri]|uniref:neuroendocrine protein 7B2-like n=1 Tax=Planococcus citri TaxID=170843 RepID=UPI0031F7A9CD